METTDINNLQTLLKALSVVNGGGRGGCNALKLNHGTEPCEFNDDQGSCQSRLPYGNYKGLEEWVVSEGILEKAKLALALKPMLSGAGHPDSNWL